MLAHHALERLGPGSLGRLPADIRRPAYSRDALTAGILHIGGGAFHRCHQGEYTDDALETEFGPWGIVALNMRAPDLTQMLEPQRGYYCRELRNNAAVERRLIGSNIGTISLTGDNAAGELDRAFSVAASSAIGVISLTVTEKGYCYVPATGELDLDHPDIVHDIAHPEIPNSVPGFILRMLALRITAGTALPAIISCDNVPDNGSTLRRCVLELAAQTNDRLADAIVAKATFLNTMVDRIVPATSPDDIVAFAEETGLTDHALVVGEPFRMWVLEDRFGGALPRWDSAGALFVPSVAPYEVLKMRVVNGIQSNLCQLGVLSDIEFMADVMKEPCFAAFALRTITREVAPHLPDVPGIDTRAYIAQAIRRLSNPALKHQTLQISTDGSQKIRQRLLEPLRAGLAKGTVCDGLLLGIAGWMQFASGRNWRGESLEITDPWAVRTRAIGSASGDEPTALVEGMLGIEAIFGEDLAQNTFVKTRLAGYVAALQMRPARAVVEDFMKADG